MNNLITYGGGAVLIGLSLVTGGLDSLNQNTQRSNEFKAVRQDIASTGLSLELSQRATEQADKVATARYSNGCIFVVAQNDASQSASIIQGEPVLDGATNAPLPDGSVVCDVNGNTGIIVNGVVSSVAFTGNKQLIDDAILRSNHDAEVLSPSQFGG